MGRGTVVCTSGRRAPWERGTNVRWFGVGADRTDQVADAYATRRASAPPTTRRSSTRTITATASIHHRHGVDPPVRRWRGRSPPAVVRGPGAGDRCQDALPARAGRPAPGGLASRRYRDERSGGSPSCPRRWVARLAYRTWRLAALDLGHLPSRHAPSGPPCGASTWILRSDRATSWAGHVACVVPLGRGGARATDRAPAWRTSARMGADGAATRRVGCPVDADRAQGWSARLLRAAAVVRCCRGAGPCRSSWRACPCPRPQVDVAWPSPGRRRRPSCHAVPRLDPPRSHVPRGTTSMGRPLPGGSRRRTVDGHR